MLHFFLFCPLQLLSVREDEESQKVFATTCYELAQYFASKSSRKDSNAHIASSYLQLALIEPERAVELLGTLNTKVRDLSMCVCMFLCVCLQAD